jgi:uncharacterized protein (DUF433 family)
VTAVATEYRHIEVDERGVPVIADSRFKVALLVEQMQAYGWDAQEAHVQHPQLTLAQIHSALAYYYDHQEHIDRYLQEARDDYEEARWRSGPSVLRQRLEGRV